MTSAYVARKKPNELYRPKDDLVLRLTDHHDQALTIKVCSAGLSDDQLDEYDCVCMSARYDHGFGFSQLYRFVDDKQSLEIKKYCDLARECNRSQLLPMSSSGRWWAIVTPIVKGDGQIQKTTCHAIMTDLIHLTRVPSVSANKILISQFRHMLSYRSQQVQGIFEAIKKLQMSGFEQIEVISFEVDDRFKNQFGEHLKSVLNQLYTEDQRVIEPNNIFKKEGE